MSPTPPGNADEYQNKWFAGKAIRKSMKTKAEEIDEWPFDFAQGKRVTSGEKSEGIPPTRVFLQKRLQAVENKRTERQKERKERKRARNRLRMQEFP